MKKFTVIIFILASFLLSTSLSAQIGKMNTWNLSLGADVIYPENNFRKTHGWGYGATVKAEYVFAKHTSVTASTGFYSLAAKTNILNPGGETVFGVPVKVGGRYYIGNFYLGGDAGLMLQSGFKKNEGFVYSFFLGDELVTGKHGNSLDISIRHEAWVTDQARAFVGLRLAYEFRLK
ncbi:MAG: hypothetical protein JNM19_14795 [Chitinophagaceae bacterium]|nr:hypothetical protein [Chitinophagaceae bacterium]